MNRILGFIIFFVVFLSIYSAMHLYAFFRLSAILGIQRNVWFYTTIIALALSLPLMSIIERTIDGKVASVIYSVSTTWLGALFLLVCILSVYEIVRLFFKFDGKIAGLAIILIVLLLVLYGIINALFIKVNFVEVPIANLKEDMTVVQLSDIHVGTIHNSGYLKEIVEKTNSLDPDVVMITGDFVDGSGKITSKTVAPLNDIKADKFFSMGNHEIYEGLDYVSDLLKETDVKMLRNELVMYKGIQIIGIDHPEREFGNDNQIIKKLKIDKDIPSILMYHPPSGIADAAAAGVSLQLSGHTHNGQIFPFNLITMLFYPRISGLYEKDGLKLHVSPGTGTWGPPMRIGSRSEITVLKLVKA